MIPRYQKVILWLLLVSSVSMAAFLIRMRARAQDQLAAVPDASPMLAPVDAPPVAVTLVLADDADGSLTAVQKNLALPNEATTRARAILNDLFAEYAQKGSTHPLPALRAVGDVFLLPAPAPKNASGEDKARTDQLAVVNLNGSFVDRHPSGIEVETVTLLSILGTLHANMPQIAQVEFLVDGQPRETLAGHADLSRTYLTAGDVPLPADTSGAKPPGADANANEGQIPAKVQP
ncbi:MAG: GerMN domain-containing protein [Acidobacteriaceae bacterium]